MFQGAALSFSKSVFNFPTERLAIEPNTEMEGSMAAKKQDLNKLSLEELKALRKDVDRAIVDFEKRKREEALKEIQAVAKKHGMSLDDVVGGKAKARKAKAAAKFRNPNDSSQEWSGRGRQPAWFKAAIAAGKQPASMEI